MRVLLINSNQFHDPWPVIPFGLCAVAATVEAAGHEVHVLDLCFSSRPGQDIVERIRDIQPELVGVSVRNIDNAAAFNTDFLIQRVKDNVITPLKAAYSGPIVIGGTAVGISGAEILSFFDLSLAIRGDGEAAMLELIRRLDEGIPLDDMEGLVRREGGQIVADRPPMYVACLDDLPRVSPHRYVDLALYRQFDSPIQVQTKRGCALRCSYCTYNTVEGKQYRLRNPQRVAEDIEHMVQETGINHFEFTDSAFNIPLNHCKAVLRALAEKKLDLKLRTMGLNPGAVDEELGDLMKEVGFRDVDLGAESGSDAMLKSLRKNFNKERVLQAGRILRERGIPINWFLLLGAPGETEDTLRETFETMDHAASKWDLISVGIGIRVYRGSPIADRMKEECPDCTKDNFLRPVHYDPATLSVDEIKQIARRAALRRPNVYMYDEGVAVNERVYKIGVTILRALAPREPVWKMYIFRRRMQRALGISYLRYLRAGKRARAA